MKRRAASSACLLPDPPFLMERNDSRLLPAAGLV